MRTRLGRTLAALTAIAVTCVAIIGGCSQSEPTSSPDAAPESSASETPEKPPVATQLVVGRVAGNLGEKQKVAMKEDVKEIVDTFFEEAYLGDFPRTSFDTAYAAFTKGARADAERDADLLSNAAISDQIDSATGAKRQVSLDVLAFHGVPHGVTARFTLDFDTSGDIQERQRVKGYLLLDHEGGHWQVFGYNLIRSVIS